MRCSITAFSLLLGTTTPFVSADECYNSTSAITVAMLVGSQTEFILCPGSKNTIAKPTDATFTEFLPGEQPLVISKPNVTIKCGESGESTNNCIITGGTVQIVAPQAITPSHPDNGTISVDGLFVKGVTFQGDLGFPDGGDLTISPTAGGSLSIGLFTMGENVVFEDCIWEDMAAHGVFEADRTSPIFKTKVPRLSQDVTIRDSVFRNIHTSWAVVSEGQRVKVENVRFENVTTVACIVTTLDGGDVTVVNSCFDDIAYANSVLCEEANETLNSTLVFDELFDSSSSPHRFLADSHALEGVCEDGFGSRKTAVSAEETFYDQCTNPFKSSFCVLDAEPSPAPTESGQPLTGMGLTVAFSLVASTMLAFLF